MLSSSYLLVADAVSARPWTPCPRTYSGNMCGIYLDGLPPVPGGASNPALVLSWFLDRFGDANQTRILDAYRERTLTDVLVSWPDSRSIGKSPQQFGDWCSSLYQRGFEPCVMLASKVYDTPTLSGLIAAVAPVLPFLTRRVGRFGVAWEANLWISPEVLQQFIDWLSPQITPWGGKLYPHFSAGVASWQPDGNPFATFWNANIGKLTGLLWQADVSWDPGYLQAKAKDILDRFAGQFFCSPESGFGHPFDCIGLELQAERVFDNGESEAVQNLYGQAAIHTPPTMGPLGPVRVMGSGNGQ
jgi:hypothetical protein